MGSLLIKDVLSVLLVLGVVGNCMGQRQGNIATFMRLMTSLKHNDECSWPTEEARQNMTKSVANLSPTSLQLQLTMEKYTSDVVNNNRKHCSAPELLVCSKDTQKCVCGDPGRQVVLPNSDITSGFVAEIDESGTMQCRWTEGTYCLSDDIFRKQGLGSFVNSKCQSGTRCTAKSDGEECSFTHLILYIFRTYRYGAARNQRQIMQDVFNGKVCTCQPNPALNSVSSDEFFNDNDNSIGARRKRSVDQFKDQDAIDSFGPSVAYLRQILY